jgi:hypothetical protein
MKWSRYRPGVAQRVGRGTALLFHGRGTRRGWVVSSTPRPHFTPWKDPVPILQSAGWAAGPVWTGGNSRPHRDSTPDRPARSSVAIVTELLVPPIIISPWILRGVRDILDKICRENHTTRFMFNNSTPTPRKLCLPLFRSSKGNANAPICYVIQTLPVLFASRVARCVVTWESVFPSVNTCMTNFGKCG